VSVASRYAGCPVTQGRTLVRAIGTAGTVRATRAVRAAVIVTRAFTNYLEAGDVVKVKAKVETLERVSLAT
jgi:hypothetical protein